MAEEKRGFAAVAVSMETMPRVTIVCDWLPPDFGAVGQYMLDYARGLAWDGKDVILIGLSSKAASKHVEAMSGGSLTVQRIACQPSSKGGLAKRGLWALAVNFRLLAAVRRACSGHPRGELIVTGSPPFLSSLLLPANALLWRQSATYRITDFYPETVLAAGRAPWLVWLKPVFKRLRRLADRIEVLGADQARRLQADGIDAAKIVLRRDGPPIAIDPDAPPLPSPFEPGSRILLYSGNLGVAHPPDIFLEAYRRHVQEGSNKVRLWMNGQGVRLPEVNAFCQRHHLPLHVSPPTPVEQLPNLLAAADAHLVLLGEQYWGYVLPSKIYGCIASGKPVLFVGPVESDVASVMAETGDLRHLQTRSADDCFRFLERMAA